MGTSNCQDDGAITLPTRPHLHGQTSDIEVFLCRPDSITDPAVIAGYCAILDADERARLSRFRSEEDRRLFLTSHALLRVALSRFADVPPDAWRFRRNRFGKPEIDRPSAVGLQFSLSHTRGLVACAVARNVEVGLDVEVVAPGGDILALAEGFFALREISVLEALPPAQRTDRFYSIWTLKEAYAKARGLGLSIPLHRFGFEIEADAIAINSEDEPAEELIKWSFRLIQPTPEHWLAIAMRGSNIASGRVATTWLEPSIAGDSLAWS